jgi:hypothetical protein
MFPHGPTLNRESFAPHRFIGTKGVKLTVL